MTERNEKRILRISFLSGLAFAIAEFIFFHIQPFPFRPYRRGI